MLVDATFLVDLMRADAGALAALADAESGSEPIRVPVPVLYELWSAVERSRQPPRELERIAQALNEYPPVVVTAEHAVRAGKLAGSLARRGIELGDVDLLVAGIAVEEGEQVITRNVRDFGRVPDLRLVTY